MGVTKQDLQELEKLNPEELANLQSAASKNKLKLDANGKPINLIENDSSNKEQKSKEEKEKIRLEDVEARKLNQLDDEAKKTLQREAMAKLSTKELELLKNIDPDLRNKLLRLDPK